MANQIAVVKTARSFISNTFSAADSLVSGGANSIKDIAAVGNIYTTKLLREAKFEDTKDLLFLEKNEESFKRVIASTNMDEKMDAKNEAEILERFEY